jgi:hypothetical protein
MSLEGEKKPDHLITVFAGLIKMQLMLQEQHMFPFPHHRQLWLCSKTEN